MRARGDALETLCSRITSRYACVRRRRTAPANAIVPFFYGTLHRRIPDEHVRLSKVDAGFFFLFRSANDRFFSE